MKDKELPKDLQDFLNEYERLANLCNFDLIEQFIYKNAIYWFSNGTYRGISQIRKAFEDTWNSIKNEKYTLSNVEWLVVTDRCAVCIYDFRSDGIVNGKRQIYEGKGTNVLEKKNRKWKIIHEHLSKNA